ncbi:MAG: FAD-binding oxidoreductase [Alphaproteobacteria bacterium]|nr:FAD-binding oxidoreductase [Alphaproteobacteria bacterium]
MKLEPAVLAALKECVGPRGFSEDPREIAPHLVEWRGKYHGSSQLLLKPQSTWEVSRLLSICYSTRTPLVPQGGNTGLVGGQIPLNGEVLLSLSRMNAIRSVDADGMSIIAEAGVVLAEVHRVADAADRYFPLSLASEGSCTIGGNVATNAGGVNVLRYGNMRDLVFGLEVVLADGRVLDLLRTLRKDNTGYDLKQLFIGSEGTLGVLTAAALKLAPKPAEHVTAFVTVPNVKSAIELLHRLQAASAGMVSAFEFMSQMALEMVLKHMPQARDPLSAPAPWYVLAEASSGAASQLNNRIERSLAEAIRDGTATDAAVAANEAQRTSFWYLRDSVSEAQKKEGGSIKHDVSVPVAAIPEFLARSIEAVEKLVPRARPVPFGHLGDGNIHLNFSVPEGGDSAAFLARWDEITRLVHDIVHEFGGSISAEHGIGLMKREEILRYKALHEMDVMRMVKHTLDPNNILNPGKVIAP